MAPDVEAEQEPLLGGKYRLRRLLARGGMSAVYAAEELPSGRKVAVKLLGDSASRNPTSAQRLYAEANAVSAIGDPNIVRIFEVGHTEDGTPYLVMELLDGQSLDAVLHLFGSLETARAVDVVAQCLSALAAAHDKGIIHRDLKPQNIFLCPGERGRTNVKVLDFGISRTWGGGSEARLTLPGVVVGTPHYMSPEQASGVRDLDGRTDIWSAGVVLYQALTGRLPYDDEVYINLLAKILDEPFPRPREVVPSISEALEQVVLKALAKDPAERYQTAAQFRDELLTAAAARPRGRPAPSRRALFALGVVLVTLALGAVVGVSTVVVSGGVGGPRPPQGIAASPAGQGAAPAAPRPAPLPATQRVETAELRVRVVPRPARTRVLVDGQEISEPGDRVRVSAGDVHVVALSAPGYHQTVIRRTIVEDTVVEVQMTPSSATDEPDRGKRASSRSQAGEGDPRAPATGEAALVEPGDPLGPQGRPLRILEEYPE